MDILIVMSIGILVGNRFFSHKYKTINEKLQLICTILLIFSMGVTLGRRENFIQELSLLGWHSFIFCFIPSLFSLIIVFLLTRHFIEKRKNNGKGKN